MQVTLEIEDLKTAVDSLNNAIVAFNHVVGALKVGVEIPPAFDKMLNARFGDDQEKKEELMDLRCKTLHNIYNQLIAELEKESL